MGLNSDIIKSSGTSQATAIISGYISLMKDYAKKKHIVLSNSQIISYLKLIKNRKATYLSILKRISY